VSPLKWHGSKSRRAKFILPLLPPCRTYVEPFAGSLGLLLKRQPAALEVANDLNADLMTFWEVVKDPVTQAEFLDRARGARVSEALFNTSVMAPLHTADKMTPVQRALAVFTVSRLSLSGRGKTFAPASKTGRLRRGMDERLSSWLSALDRLPAVSARLRGVKLRCQPGLEVIEEFDGEDVLFLVDPPYVHATRASTDVYACEMTDRDHRELLDVLLGCKAKIALCGYANPLYDDKLDGWRRHEYQVPNDGAIGATKRTMTECLWVNY
jgi:DNA adenine methylase